MKIGVVKETYPGEKRVVLVPSVLPSLIKGGMEVLIESKAGEQAGYSDSAYVEKGGVIADSREQVFQMADCILQVRLLGANLQEGKADLPGFRKGQMLIGMAEALSHSISPRLGGSRDNFVCLGTHASYYSCTEYGYFIFYGDCCRV